MVYSIKIMITTGFIYFIIFILSSNNVLCQYHNRRHQHHYMMSTTTTPPPPIRPRFPHLDRILNRLDAEKMASTPRPVSTIPPSKTWPGRSTWEMEQAVLAAHPEMLRDEWMFDDEEDEDSEEVSAEEDPYDYRRGPHPGRHHQQDEAVHTGGAPGGAPAGGSAFTRFKWYTLGSRQEVSRTRSRHVNAEKDFQEALQHAVRVLQEGHCQQPRPRVVRVSDVYPHPSKTYIPSCTILHQCGEGSGCCSYEGMACVAKHSHPVELPFYTSTVAAGGKRGSGTAPGVGGASVERLLFYNHTECECQDRVEAMPRDRQAALAASVPAPDTRQYLRLPPASSSSSAKPPGLRSFRSSEDDKTSANKGCRCPSEYSVRQLENGTCVCDCFDRQRDCLKFKKGKHSFSVADRNCVLNRDCREPACEFGAYILRAGRCPIKWEQYGMMYHGAESTTHGISESHGKPVQTPWSRGSDPTHHKPHEVGHHAKTGQHSWASPEHKSPDTPGHKPYPWSGTSDGHQSKPSSGHNPPWSAGSETQSKPTFPWGSSSEPKPQSSHFSWAPPSNPAPASKPSSFPWTSHASQPAARVPPPPWAAASSGQGKPSSYPWNTDTQNKPSWSSTGTSDQSKTGHQYSSRVAPESRPAESRPAELRSSGSSYPWNTGHSSSGHSGRTWESTGEQPRSSSGGFPWNPAESTRPKPATNPWGSRPARDTRDPHHHAHAHSSRHV